jgi:TPP-dependent pyruvate/acetoin dehydrogenase alpha subunit
MYARLYRSLYRIRRVEEEVARVYPTDRIKSPVHLSIGQEAVSVGVCDALAPGDVVFGTYRSHAGYLAKGGDLPAMIAELYGKDAGCARGKGGSMHLVDVAAGFMGTSAVVGTTIPNAAGYAYACKVQRRRDVVVSFFGDGAADEGVFHETLNFAAIKRLPMIFVCENNGYAIHTPSQVRQSNPRVWEHARLHGIPSERVEGNDVLAIRERVSAALAEVREGAGPRFFECMTYRWCEHVGPGEDYAAGYRGRDELEPWQRDDQVAKMGARLDPAERAAIEASVEGEVRAAFEFAEAAPFPEARELYTDVFKE